MSNRTPGLDDRSYAYLLAQGLREPEVLQRLREATALEPGARMRSAPEQGALLSLLLRLMGARCALEIGTYTGYGTLWIALALPEDGSVTTLERDERPLALARRHWREAGVEPRIEVVLGPALETLDAMVARGERARFDFAFIDADKESYPAYYERCLELVRPGGLIAADNTLWGGAVADPDRNDPATEGIRRFNARVHADERVDMVLLPIADGLTLVRRR